MTNYIESLVACRLIPLSKDPGVRPIGISEVIQRIIKKDIVMSADGAEIAIRAATELFQDDAPHGILQIDVNNAFDSNRKVALHNLRILCPELAIFTNNCCCSIKVIHFGWSRDQVNERNNSG